MKRWLVDTNVVLRFLLADDKELYLKAKKYFNRARRGEIELILISQVVFEVEYVLKRVYGMEAKARSQILRSLVLSIELKVPTRDVLLSSINLTEKKNIDLVDAYLVETAKKEKIGVLSFDKKLGQVLKERV